MAASHLMQKASLRQVPICCQKTSLHAGPLLVRLTCSKPVCRESLRLATCVAAASSVSRPRLAKDRLQFHLFINYSRNRGSRSNRTKIACHCYKGSAFSGYKTAYDSHTEIDKSHFDYII